MMVGQDPYGGINKAVRLARQSLISLGVGSILPLDAADLTDVFEESIRSRVLASLGAGAHSRHKLCERIFGDERGCSSRQGIKAGNPSPTLVPTPPLTDGVSTSSRA